MRCLFVPTNKPNVYRCARWPKCRHVVPSKFPPEQIYANCQATVEYAMVPWYKRAWRFFKSMAKWAKKRFERVNEHMLTARMQACTVCAARKGQICQPCGCWLPLKQVMATEGCALGLWEKTCDNGCGERKG